MIKLPRVPKLFMPKVSYAKVGLFHKITLAVIYVGIIGTVVTVASVLGSRITTRSLPSGNIELVVPYSKYVVGDEISFTVKNNFNSKIYFPNNCPNEPLDVYRLENQKWVRIHDKADTSDCREKNRQIIVDAHSSASGNFKAWRHLFDKPGKYRVVAAVEYYNSLPYQDFEVVEKPAIPAIPAVIPPKVVTVPQQSAPSSASTTSSSSNGSSTTTPPPATSPSGNTRQSKTVTISGGTANVQYDSTTVYVISVTPAAGYTYEGGGSGRLVEITFKKPGSEIQLQLSVRGGQLVQKVEND